MLSLLLWFIRKVAPNRTPDLIPNWNPVPNLVQKTGYQIDHEPMSVKFVLSIMKHLPIDDPVPDIDLHVASSHILQCYGNLIPIESGKETSLADFLWNQTGSFFLKPYMEDVWVADFSNFEAYSVREGYYRYGGKVFLRDGTITHYQYLGETHHNKSVFMDLIIRSTLCLKIMVEYHALRIHLCTAQKMTIDFRNKEYSDLLYILTFNVLDINREIGILIEPKALTYRLFALTEFSFNRLLGSTLLKEPLRRKEFFGSPGTEWYRKIIQYTRYVDQLMNDLQIENYHKEMIADFLVVSTAIHNQFGDAQIYSMTINGFLLPKVSIRNMGKISKQDIDLLETLLTAVSLRFPLIKSEKVASIFRKPDDQIAWSKFTRKLVSYTWFDPNYFEISVGF